MHAIFFLHFPVSRSVHFTPPVKTVSPVMMMTHYLIRADSEFAQIPDLRPTTLQDLNPTPSDNLTVRTHEDI